MNLESLQGRELRRSEKIEPQSGVAFELSKGELLKVVDPCGEQVADLFCFDQADHDDALSSGRSIDYEETIYFSRGHRLYGQSGRVMLRILEDTCGRHDFLVTPCSLQMFQMISGKKDWHPSCLENLSTNLSKFGFDPSKIGTSLNIFMNVPVDLTGKIKVERPLSKAGDFVLFAAEMDLVIGLTACSDEGTNAGTCKPIEFEIYRS